MRTKFQNAVFHSKIKTCTEKKFDQKTITFKEWSFGGRIMKDHYMTWFLQSHWLWTTLIKPNYFSYMCLHRTVSLSVRACLWKWPLKHNPSLSRVLGFAVMIWIDVNTCSKWDFPDKPSWKAAVTNTPMKLALACTQNPASSLDTKDMDSMASAPKKVAFYCAVTDSPMVLDLSRP